MKQYEILNTAILVDMKLKQTNYSRLEVPFNKCISAYKLNMPDAIIVMATGQYGLVFYDATAYQDALDKQYFPIHDEHPSLFTSEREKIQDIANQEAYFMNKFSEAIGFNVILSEDAKYLKKLQQHFKQTYSTKQVPFLDNYLYLYLCLLIKNKVDGYWEFEKSSTINSFYVPRICDKEHLIYFVHKYLYQRLRNIKSFSIEKCLNDTYAFPGSKPYRFLKKDLTPIQVKEWLLREKIGTDSWEEISQHTGFPLQEIYYILANN